jgi:hypothetical protein
MARTPPTNSPRLALARQTRVLADVDADADVVALAAPPRAPSPRPSTPRRPSISRVHARATTSRALPSSQRRPRARSHVPTPFAARRRRPARAGGAPRVVPVVPARVPARISPRAPPRVRARPFASITRPIDSLETSSRASAPARAPPSAPRYPKAVGSRPRRRRRLATPPRARFATRSRRTLTFGDRGRRCRRRPRAHCRRAPPALDGTAERGHGGNRDRHEIRPLEYERCSIRGLSRIRLCVIEYLGFPHKVGRMTPSR